MPVLMFTLSVEIHSLTMNRILSICHAYKMFVCISTHGDWIYKFEDVLCSTCPSLFDKKKEKILMLHKLSD